MPQRARARVAGAALAIAAGAGCGAYVAPGDPLFGTWRCEPYDEVYPAPPSTASRVDELTFEASGAMSIVTTRRYPIVAGDRLSGCTWVERRPMWRWLRIGDAGMRILFVPEADARYTSERTGCADPAQNRGPNSFDEDALLAGLSGVEYAIRGETLSLTITPPGGRPPATRDYARVRR